jgi:hypothetical protein
MEIIKLQEIEMLGKKPAISPSATTYIAGGAIRQWFTGKESVSDIDVFGTTEQSLLEFEKSLVGYTKLYDNKLNKTYKKNDILVQLIIARYFPTVKDLFEYFDFNVCQFAWTNNGIYSTSSAIISVLRGHLGVNKIHPEFAADSLRSSVKIGIMCEDGVKCFSAMYLAKRVIVSLLSEERSKYSGSEKDGW